MKVRPVFLKRKVIKIKIRFEYFNNTFLEINFWNVIKPREKIKTVIEDIVATFPPYFALFILIESFIRMRNSGDGMR